MLIFLKTRWPWLLAGLVLLVVGAQFINYATAWLARRHLRSEQAQATATHARQQAATTARYTAYRLDSVRRATERQELVRHLRNLEKQDDSLSKNRPARIALPAFGDLPRE